MKTIFNIGMLNESGIHCSSVDSIAITIVFRIFFILAVTMVFIIAIKTGAIAGAG